MKIQRSIAEPIRPTDSWEARWKGVDDGLIACWERGREKAVEDPEFASRAQRGQLIILPWKGGVEKTTKRGTKYGTFFYLAMWQGLRGEDLNIDTADEISLRCAATKMMVILTGDFAKYANAAAAEPNEYQ